MKTLKIIFFANILLAASACSDELVGTELPNDPITNFEYFWQTIDSRYGLFEVKKIDWQKIHDQYRPIIDNSTTDEELYAVLKDMINTLNDNHVNLYPTTHDLPAYPGGLLRVQNGNVIITKVQSDYDLAVTRTYLTDFKNHSPNISSAFASTDIGYLNIKGTDGQKATKKALEESIKRFSASSGLVIDIRGFYGGSDAVTQLIASHFTSSKKLYMTTRKRNGPAHNDFTEPASWFIEPVGESQFTKPIILLTSRFSQSAAETFALAMKELDHVKLLGDTTAGGYSDNPTTEMPNGWMFSFSVGDFRAADGKSYEGIGTAPDVWLVNTKEDLLAGKDRVLQRAIEMLR